MARSDGPDLPRCNEALPSLKCVPLLVERGTGLRIIGAAMRWINGQHERGSVKSCPRMLPPGQSQNDIAGETTQHMLHMVLHRGHDTRNESPSQNRPLVGPRRLDPMVSYREVPQSGLFAERSVQAWM